MDYIFWIGIVGSLILVTGAALPEPVGKIHPVKSLKNWLFTGGGVLMFAYALLNYLGGGPVFFLFLPV